MEINNTEEFKNLFKTLPDNKKYVLIDFYATWCKKCVIIEPHLEKLLKNYDDVLFIKMKIDKNEELSEKYNIISIPSIVILNKNEQQIYETISGSNGMIEKVKERLDCLNKDIEFDENF